MIYKTLTPNYNQSANLKLQSLKNNGHYMGFSRKYGFVYMLKTINTITIFGMKSSYLTIINQMPNPTGR
jgi:hypothetical protein